MALWRQQTKNFGNKWKMMDNVRISYQEFQNWVQQRRRNQQKM